MDRSELSRHRAQKPALDESDHQAVYCTVSIQPQAFPTDLLQHITHTNTYLGYIKGACAVGRFDLASSLTIDCHTSLRFYGHSQ